MPDPLYSSRFTQGKLLTASDTNMITGPSGQSGTSAIYTLTAGNLVCSFIGSKGTRITVPVVEGQELHWALAYFYTASTCTIAGLW